MRAVSHPWKVPPIFVEGGWPRGRFRLESSPFARDGEALVEDGAHAVSDGVLERAEVEAERAFGVGVVEGDGRLDRESLEVGHDLGSDSGQAGEECEEWNVLRWHSEPTTQRQVRVVRFVLSS